MIVNSNILLKRKIGRSGIIPYTSKDNEMHFLLAKDNQTDELGDFGGGAKSKENGLDTAMREFEEESKGIFLGEFPNIDYFVNKISVTGDNMAVTFVYIDPKWLSKDETGAVRQFRKKRKRDDEIIDVVWVNKITFEKLVNQRQIREDYQVLKMWKKVRTFFKKIKVDEGNAFFPSIQVV